MTSSAPPCSWPDTYCPGCGDWPASADCCSNTGTTAYYHKLDLARKLGFINRTVFTFGWIIGKSERNPTGWTKSSLRAAMSDLKTKYPEVPGVIMCERRRPPSPSVHASKRVLPLLNG